jgi:hypothetical protein
MAFTSPFNRPIRRSIVVGTNFAKFPDYDRVYEGGAEGA